MRSFISIAAASLATFAYAMPEPIFGASKLAARDATCMSADEANQVALNFNHLISAYSEELANASLTVGFEDYSDSVISLIDAGCAGPLPLGTATFSSRAAFIAGQGNQPDIPFDQLNVWYNCDTVILRWRTTLNFTTPAPEFVTGIIVLETTAAPGGAQPWLINTVYSEFNSGAWLVDLGTFVPNCTAPARRLLRA
ncbi:hypothetical protein LTR02_013837 [Friedmanniomyces endolithicus]|nr:hypothetical protein LTR94_003285 [Friedmanniomyces endolithicus]KAK0805128.1 hypothetical protein LTR59_004069 [Friedmanniomyces endolithicus]KAK0818355.1 hypothetical protein LTR75_002668 [Friedmanniomyces endolithicus]KAK0839987.1 hypothetical protein LTR03_010879 [Friedmanniomyces endolithicus]KAK0884513.1 hypothetical protein LTR87_001856 [Friedmanniomyces endolithicus]